MTKNGWTVKEGQNIKIFLKNNYVYTGQIQDITQTFLKIHDWKTGKKVVINATEVARIEEIDQKKEEVEE